MTSPTDDSERGLDYVLGQDVNPLMGQDARKRLAERLAEARAGSADPDRSPADAELDVVLSFDAVRLPEGLAGRVLERVRAEGESDSPDVLVPVPTADAPRRGWRPRLLVPIAAAVAAALTLWMLRGQSARPALTEPDASGRSGLVATDPEFEVSDDLLASLSVLENMDFVTDGLDPFEADALFLFEPEDQVLFDLLVSENYEFDGVEGDPQDDQRDDQRDKPTGRPAGGNDR
jgi:hypothetical protein